MFFRSSLQIQLIQLIGHLIYTHCLFASNINIRGYTCHLRGRKMRNHSLDLLCSMLCTLLWSNSIFYYHYSSFWFFFYVCRCTMACRISSLPRKHTGDYLWKQLARWHQVNLSSQSNVLLFASNRDCLELRSFNFFRCLSVYLCVPLAIVVCMFVLFIMCKIGFRFHIGNSDHRWFTLDLASPDVCCSEDACSNPAGVHCMSCDVFFCKVS